MTEQLAVIYLNTTNHVLAAVQQSATTPTLATVIGSGGLHVAGVRGVLAPNVAGYGAATSQEERFVIPTAELSMRALAADRDAIIQPHAFIVDTTTLAKLPSPGGYRDVSIGLTQTHVQIGSTDPVNPGSLSFATDTQVFIQVEGPTPGDRRVMRGTFPAGQTQLFKFALTVEPGGPQAPIAIHQRYFILVMIEGKSPDARTVTL